MTGKPNTWACGIVYAIGSTNFLFDRSQTPHMRAFELAEMFGISQSTAGNKAAEIKRLANIKQLDPDWTLPSRLGDNPRVWMFQTNSGYIFDVRYAPRDVQEEFFDAGMNPFIYVEIKPETAREENKIEPPNEDKPARKREQTKIEGQIAFDDE